MSHLRVTLQAAREEPNRYKIYKKVCKVCGVEFECIDHKQIYCYGRCLLNARKKTCVKCGTTSKVRVFRLIDAVPESIIHICPSCKGRLKTGELKLTFLKLDYSKFPMAARIVDAVRYGSYDILGRRIGIDEPFAWTRPSGTRQDDV